MTTNPYALACEQFPEENLQALIGKRPPENQWSRLSTERQCVSSRARYARSPIAYNVGVVLGWRGLVAVDFDTDDTVHLLAMLEVLPPIRAAKRGRRGFTAFYFDPSGDIRTERLGIVEVLARGTQTVIPPSLHPLTGLPYIWIDPAGLGG
jgi:hypothetical protein